VVRLCQTFPKGPAAKHILGQLVRAATGGGSNYEEARGAEKTMPDKTERFGIGGRPRLGLFGGVGSSGSICSQSSSGMSANLVSTQRVDHTRSARAITRRRIGNSRVARVAPGPHRSGRADFLHPALRETGLLDEAKK
jgi:hypothetical protein